MKTLLRDVALILRHNKRARHLLVMAVLASIGAQLSPMSNHLGFVSALIAALLGSVAAASVGATIPSQLREDVERKQNRSGPTVLLAAITYAVVWVLLLGLITWVASKFRAPCATGKGSVWWLVVAFPGPILASMMGLLMGSVVSKRGRAGLWAMLMIVVFVVWSVVRFYQTPGVFSFDPFFGFWPGVLYDESIRLDSTILTYRLGTLAWMLSLGSLFVSLWDVETTKLRRPTTTPSLVLSVVSTLLALGVYAAGPMLGHRMDAADVEQELGGRINGTKCNLVYARSIGTHDARLHFQDCEFRVRQIERYFGLQIHRPITAFIFEDSAQKQRLMGAADTYLAKPWRNEVYLQNESFPHPVLKHELAHAVAREMGAWPFYATSRYRLLPLPGIIEGAAVAAAWEGESDATPHEWTHAMMDAQLLPNIESIMGIGFYGHSAGTAYTAAGSFIRWLIEQKGTARFQQLYRTGDFQDSYGTSLSVLVQQWKRFLVTVPVRAATQQRASARFRRASIFARVCPHETAESINRAGTLLSTGAVVLARDELLRAVRNDPTDTYARMALAEAWTRMHEPQRARAVGEELARVLGPTAAERVRSRVADVVWRWEGPAAARSLYTEMNVSVFDEDESRTLEVRRWAVTLPSSVAETEAQEAVRDLLVGRENLPVNPLTAVARLSSVIADPTAQPSTHAMAVYLVVRQLWRTHRYDAALRQGLSIDQTLLPTDQVRWEAQRLIASSQFHLGQFAQAEAGFRALAANTARTSGGREDARDWAERAASMGAAQGSPHH